jgi:hypothetical protein
MTELTETQRQSKLLLEAITQVEKAVQQEPLSTRILSSMKN